MLKVHYEHPPRKWDFYLLLVSYLIAFWSPVLIVSFTWSQFPMNIHSFLIIAYSIVWGLVFYRPLINFFVMRYDRGLDKVYDVTEKNLPVPATLVNAVVSAETLGFNTVAVNHDYSLIGATPKTSWVMKNPIGDIWIQISELEGDPTFLLHFMTAFENNRFVQTAYPFYDTVEATEYVFDAVSNSIEECYAVHERNIAKFAQHSNAPMLLNSLDDFYLLCEKREEVSRKTVIVNARLRAAMLFFAVSLLFASFIYILAGFGLALVEIVPISLPSLLLSAPPFLLIALIWKYSVPQGRDISQAKKKAA